MVIANLKIFQRLIEEYFLYYKRFIWEWKYKMGKVLFYALKKIWTPSAHIKTFARFLIEIHSFGNQLSPKLCWGEKKIEIGRSPEVFQFSIEPFYRSRGGVGQEIMQILCPLYTRIKGCPEI